jgi:hypothetical protein
MISWNAWHVNGAAGPLLEVSTMQIEINRSTLSLAREGLVAIGKVPASSVTRAACGSPRSAM